MNAYRVDRVNQKVVPLGMTSIRYIGDNYHDARDVFDSLSVGLDAWDNPNSTYGVILSVYSPDKRDYVIKCIKGLDT